MQLLILASLIAFIASAPVANGGDFKSHGHIAGNNIRGSVHAPQNTCNNGVKVIGGTNTSFDNSCTNTSVESDTDDHSNSDTDDHSNSDTDDHSNSEDESGSDDS
ncbi:hypothetical protein CONCODRAFT_74301 [Conidiobolus coronatus NRRL 28638]|uniref:Chaplin domain-containing protein n=1 Tax=Conidiobolus coronatus (strain ATCC 28846 / CBS 209.66 / NRRL 28638) TaxID=796925 RepID=A0A137NRN3_CONC2|nr:hypothetical protein CONCODRAFT_74301 [Conidiobolus coronatus NRRL 28638]|eukprot:KXN65423.1 hypothetical protein CONCODRAFT_74301 [Conidiobolus coronatus NRRL 28638]